MFEFYGAIAGRVSCNNASQHYLGSQSKSSVSAKLSAMCWALCWCVSKALKSVAAGFKPHVKFNYDCLLSGGVAFALWNSKSEPRLAGLIENLAYILVAIANVSHEHVKSHEVYPWNTLVDNCCALIRNHDSSYLYDELVSFSNFRNPVHEWAIPDGCPHFGAPILLA